MSKSKMKYSTIVVDFVVFFVVWFSSEAKDHRRRPPKLILHETCNKTLTPPPIKSSVLTIRHSTASTDDTSPVYCWTRFLGSDDQYIEITVKELRTGPESCLKISDHEQKNFSHLMPRSTTLCGSDDVSRGGKTRVRRRTWSPSALVEFKSNKVKPEAGGFEYDATFVSKEEDVEKLPYGHADRKEGRMSNTKCDWLIRVDDCVGYCSIISPGHPGVYPPNTRCRYHLENSDNLRVELKFGAKYFSGVFDLRESKNCEEDYVEVYDGRSVSHPLIGRFCGSEGAHIISSGSSILMIFQSGTGSNQSRNYTGFNMQTTERWTYHNDPIEGGFRKPNSSCDLVFYSVGSFSGDLHTPDYFLSTETNCTYEFHGTEKYRERIEMTVVTQQLSHSDQKNCPETLAVYDGATEVRRFCLDRVGGGREEFVFNTTSTSAFVRYHKAEGQTSNPDPAWISFKFFRLPRSNAIPPAPGRKDGSAMSDGGSGQSLDPDDLIMLRLPADGPLSINANAAKSNKFRKTMSVYRMSTITIPHLLLVTYFRRK